MKEWSESPGPEWKTHLEYGKCRKYEDWNGWMLIIWEKWKSLFEMEMIEGNGERSLWMIEVAALGMSESAENIGILWFAQKSVSDGNIRKIFLMSCTLNLWKYWECFRTQDGFDIIFSLSFQRPILDPFCNQPLIPVLILSQFPPTKSVLSFGRALSRFILTVGHWDPSKKLLNELTNTVVNFTVTIAGR
jgi:hypothetical protein